MPRERPLIEPTSPSINQTPMRGIISPCKGCKNNIPVNDGELDNIEYDVGPVCPKRLLYKLKENHKNTSDEYNWDGPIFDVRLRPINPVWPGFKDYGNAYAYVFVATFEDNVDTGWNPKFDTERIVCRGPYLIKGTERQWHIEGHLEQDDPVIIYPGEYFIQGQLFKGFVEGAQVWQVARGYVREIDHNLGKSNSANGEL